MNTNKMMLNEIFTTNDKLMQLEDNKTEVYWNRSMLGHLL